MDKPIGRRVICIKEYDTDTQEIEYQHVEMYEKNPLRGLARKYVPRAGDRIYIYPDSNIPRFKLKRFCEAYKVSIAKVKETADVFFMEPKTANEANQFYTKDNYATLMNKEYFINYIKRSTVSGDTRYVKLLEDLNTCTETVIYLKEYHDLKKTGINGYTLDVISSYELNKHKDDEAYLALINNEVREIYYIENEAQQKSFEYLEGKAFYHPDAMLALLNEGSVLDKEMYDGIINLFNSTDKNDHKVAMEAMSNCDYEKSAVYLLMTFYHNRSKIYDCDSRNHVNFKSFLNFFKLQASGSIGIDDVIDKLKDKKLLDSTNLAIVMKEAKKVIKETISGDTEYFMFTDIEPTEEIKKEVEETDAENAAALVVVVPEPVIVPVVESTPEPIVEPVFEKQPEDSGSLSHL